MLIGNGVHWASVAIDIKNYVLSTYPTNYYADGYGLTNTIFLANLTPKQPAFYGPKVLNIFIVGQPYGAVNDGLGNWSIDWSLMDFHKQIIKDNYHKWTENLTYFYADKTLGDAAVAADPECGPALKDLLDEVFAQIQSDCEGEMADFGWRWKGDITSLVGFGFFQPAIDDFYQNTPS